MEEDHLNIDETTLSVDLTEATDAVKESRFEHALNLLKITLKDHPDNIDCLYLAAVSARYLKKFDDSKQSIFDVIQRVLFTFWLKSYRSEAQRESHLYNY